MSERKRRRRTARSRPAEPARPVPRRRPPRLRSAALLVALALLAALAWWLSNRASEQRPLAAAAGGIVPVPLDSLRAAARMFEAATRRNDLAGALHWQQRIVAALPRDPFALRQLAETLHNHHFAVTLPDGGQHWLLRNSVVRAEWEARVLALFDSSAAVAQDPVDRASAHYWKGRSADYEGLSLDALAEYEAGLAIVPTDTVLLRARDLELQRLRTEP